MVHRIIAGDVCDIKGDKGHWLIVDIGFSSTQPSCGVWNGAGEPKVFTFGDLVALTTHEVQADDPQPLNLLIEAPLSVAFRQNGNPIRRNCDICDGMRREWYVNAGAATLVAAGYLLRAIHGCQRQREVKVVRGFCFIQACKEQTWNQFGAARSGPAGRIGPQKCRLESGKRYLLRSGRSRKARSPH